MNPSISHVSFYSTMSASHIFASILTVSGITFSDTMYRRSQPVKPASLSTVIFAKRGTAESMNSRHMRGAMIISIRRYVSLSHYLDCEGRIKPAPLFIES